MQNTILRNDALDELDRSILRILQADAHTPNVEIARRIRMAPSATLERIRKLECRNIIRGYAARLDPVALGLDLLAFVFVFVRISGRVGGIKTARRLAAIPGVQEVHHIAGEDCFLVKVRAANPEALGELLRTRFGAIPEVTSTRTTIVLETIEETSNLPVPDSAGSAKSRAHTRKKARGGA
jgi:Lrp/AsnC family leucine-responsive transcriptional regulator